MGLMAMQNSAAIAPVEEGVHLAICYLVADLGSHVNPAYNKESRKVLIGWEIPGVRASFERDGQTVDMPRAVSKRYTISLSEKACLRRDLEAWRGRAFTPPELEGFDLQKLLGSCCQLQITHETSPAGKLFAKVASLMAVPKGIRRPKPENAALYFSFDDFPAPGKPVIPPTMAEWVGKIIMESREWKAACGSGVNQPAAPAGAAGPGTEDVPF